MLDCRVFSWSCDFLGLFWLRGCGSQNIALELANCISDVLHDVEILGANSSNDSFFRVFFNLIFDCSGTIGDNLSSSSSGPSNTRGNILDILFEILGGLGSKFSSCILDIFHKIIVISSNCILDILSNVRLHLLFNFTCCTFSSFLSLMGMVSHLVSWI